MKYLTFISTFLFAFIFFTANAQSQQTQEQTQKTQQTQQTPQTSIIEADIIDIALSDVRLSTLTALLIEADLVSDLQENGERYTVFAPTNEAFEAFEALSTETVEELMADRETLREVLLSHVVVGEVRSTDVIELNEAEMASGETIKVKVSDYSVNVGDANIVQVDLMATNGVIHVIDSVIIPNKDKKKDYDRERRSYGSDY